MRHHPVWMSSPERLTPVYNKSDGYIRNKIAAQWMLKGRPLYQAGLKTGLIWLPAYTLQ